jgi:hypothetical protein
MGKSLMGIEFGKLKTLLENCKTTPQKDLIMMSKL